MIVQDLIQRINERLEELIPNVNAPHSLLFEGARYSLLLPGKRLRPRLLLSMLEDYNRPIEEGLDVACALEMIHTYSLIHDDLPCMDDDDLRRGKPTLHKVYGEGQAILMGDFLLTYAFEILAASAFPKVIAVLARAAGGHGMIGGQVVDLLSEGSLIDWETLKFMYLGKTAALFGAAFECGAHLGNATQEEQELLREVGQNFGIAFQIWDDILDVVSTEEVLGKKIGSDQANQKANAVTLFGIEKAHELMRAYQEKALLLLPSHLKQTKGILLEHCNTV